MFLFEFDNLFRALLPVLWEHFTEHGVTPSMYASSWFMTLFGNVFCQPLANRILDLFLLDGFIVIFQVALAILQSNREMLLRQNFEHLLAFLARSGLRDKYAANYDDLLTSGQCVHHSLD